MPEPEPVPASGLEARRTLLLRVVAMLTKLVRVRDDSGTGTGFGTKEATPAVFGQSGKILG